MFYNDWTIQRLAAEHQRELRCQAQAGRLTHAAIPQPDRRRWLSWPGQRLQAQHKAAVTLAATSAALRAATERGCQTR